MTSSGQSIEIKSSLLSGSLYGLTVQIYIGLLAIFLNAKINLFSLTHFLGYNEKLSLFNSIYGKGGFIKVENSSYLLDDTLDGIFLEPGNYNDFVFNYHFLEKGAG